ncbi:ATP-dependent zinc protease [Catenovulum maritimum]|uniref:Ribosomal protein S6 modification protein n=1 Tax=Catenovulum maritimum TaxID=1513271 RepID=A0A0J8GR38_9ALTE|nr:ATP-dependent zinc protease [Catenovulum maritimum]KMT63654.1 ribosomal protein S6 modification protein [Catenovulum maritimum]
MNNDKMLVGVLEQCSLPELGIFDLKVRIDTGAQTSSLHVDNIKTIKKNGKPWVTFDIHPDIYHVEDVVSTTAKLIDIRWVKSSNGTRQQRYVVSTPIKLGGRSWSIQITLTDRSDMTYLMLLGREAMQGQLLVDPSASFLCGNED